MSAMSYLYFHSPCFDGIVSAVIARDFLISEWAWTSVSLNAVNYHLKKDWLSTPLPERTAVVDFLYHPMAEFWADHHQTAFLDDKLSIEYQFKKRSGAAIYDRDAKSCAGVLWRHLKDYFGYRNEERSDLVFWADKTDSAQYESIDEAIDGEAPALQINLSLAANTSAEYSVWLVSELSERSLTDVAFDQKVQEYTAEVRQRMDKGMDRLQQVIKLKNYIALFDVDSKDVIVSRYGPFRFYPDAHYTAGIRRTGSTASVSVMRNPWLDFECINLGELASRYGGGGHQRIGTIVLRGEETKDAKLVLDKMLDQIAKDESGNLPGSGEPQ